MSSPLGRFISPDPLGGNIYDPQTLNKYVYVRNNPVRFVDPTGMYICENNSGNAVTCNSGDFVDFEKSRQNGLKKKNKDIIRVLEAYGDPDMNNGVRLRIDDPNNGKTGSIELDIEEDKNAANGIRATALITIKSGLNGNDLEAVAAHEGSHVADAQDFVKSITGSTTRYELNFTKYDAEMRAYSVEHIVHNSNNQSRPFDCGQQDKCRLGIGAGIPIRQIQNHLALPPYSVSPTVPGQRMYPSFVPPSATIPQK
jgi:hypothetical protein